MFNNLIESSSHSSELKRRGSFFLFTTASYALLFAIAGVASIYAYDAQLGERNLEVLVTLAPVELSLTKVIADPAPAGPTRPHSPIDLDIRRNPTTAVDVSTLVPRDVSSSPNPNLPVRGPYKLGDEDSNASIPSSTLVSTGEGRGPVTPTIVEVMTPPPAPTPVPAPKVLKLSEVLNTRALSLPKPNYPQMAKMIGLQGRVTVQVLIDETGKVISARAVDGHPMFRQVSESAAYQARFSPARLNDQPVKVSGVITYNFVLQ